MTKRCIHDRVICYDCAKVGDSAKRAHNIINSYVVFVPYDQLVRSWVAIRLEDGGHDGNLYDSRQDAIRHQAYEKQCAYFCYRDSPNGFGNPKDAQVFLDYHRAAYKVGRLPDPDSGMQMIMPLTKEGIYKEIAAMGLNDRTLYV